MVHHEQYCSTTMYKKDVGRGDMTDKSPGNPTGFPVFLSFQIKKARTDWQGFFSHVMRE